MPAIAPIFETRYHIHRWLNVGGQGTLYLVSRKAVDSNDASPSSYKVIKRIRSLDIIRANYILRECLMVNRMRNGNENIIEYTDAFLDYEVGQNASNYGTSASTDLSSISYDSYTPDSSYSSFSIDTYSSDSSDFSGYDNTGCYVNLEMEWYPLGDLADLMRSCPKKGTRPHGTQQSSSMQPSHGQTPFWDTHTLCRIMFQICYALQHVHSHKIIHRDLKPSNILVDYKGQRLLRQKEEETENTNTPQEVPHRITSHDQIDWDEFNVAHLELVLCDFGVAHESQFKNSSKANSAVGTELYSSPERIRQLDYSYQSDIWSLGVILYQLLTGHESVPCFALDLLLVPNLRERIQQEIVQRLGHPEIFSSIMLQCLNFMPHERPTSRHLCDLFNSLSHASLEEIHQLHSTMLSGSHFLPPTIVPPSPASSAGSLTPRHDSPHQWSSPHAYSGTELSSVLPTQHSLPIVPHRLRHKKNADNHQALISFFKSLSDEHLHYAQQVHRLLRAFVLEPAIGARNQTVLEQSGVIHQMVFHASSYLQRKIIHSLCRFLELEHRSINLPFQYSNSVRNIRKKIVISHFGFGGDSSNNDPISPRATNRLPQLTALSQRELSKSFLSALASYKELHQNMPQHLDSLEKNFITPPFLPDHPEFDYNLLLYIFEYLTIPHLILHAGLVNKQWYVASYNDSMWKRITQRISKGIRSSPRSPPEDMLWRDFFVYKVIMCLDSVHQIGSKLVEQRLNAEPLHTHAYQHNDFPHQEGVLEKIVLVEKGQEHVFFFPLIRTIFPAVHRVVNHIKTLVSIQKLEEVRDAVVAHPYCSIKDRAHFVSFNKISNEVRRRETERLVEEMHDEFASEFRSFSNQQQKEVLRYMDRLLHEIFLGFVPALPEEQKERFLELQKAWSRQMQSEKKKAADMAEEQRIDEQAGDD